MAHRRLAVMDLSEAGAQPMQSACGRWVVAFNGEIYSHMRLREELGATGRHHAWRGHSDTETLLELIAAEGFARAIPRCDGMFAIAAWDLQEQVLWLARDRFGEKPMHYGRVGDDLVAASELRAFTCHPAWSPVIDRAALEGYLATGWIQGPATIWHGITKLQPGTLVRIGQDGGTSVSVWWNLAAEVTAGAADPFVGTMSAAVDALEQVMQGAVDRQMAADVPLGAFLSGGVDSSLLTALMVRARRGQVSTFTVGFDEAGYDESAAAAAVAAHLGTSHRLLRATPAEALAEVPTLADTWDEPFADASQIVTKVVCRLARQHVTVALSGDGGDEMFAGYTRHHRGLRAWQRLGAVPGWLRCGVASLVGGPAAGRAVSLMERLGVGLGARSFEKLDKFLRAAPATSPAEWYRRLLTFPSDLSTAAGPAGLRLPELPDLAPLTTIQLLDQSIYLPDDILVKVDRAAMASSLETRAPFLDPEVARFAWRLPESMRATDHQGKVLLRSLLQRYLPRNVAARPKAGFTPPLHRWLRGALRPWAEPRIAALITSGEWPVDPQRVATLWQRFQQGDDRPVHQLWTLLMLVAWRERWIAGPVVVR